MKRLTIVTMQLHTPGGIERFVTTLATMFATDYEVEIIANYGKPTDSLAFPLPSNIKLRYLTPIKPIEVSMKYLVTHFKWTKIPAELRRRCQIKKVRNQAFAKHLANLDTDIIITDRALYSNLVAKHYHGSAKKIATDHNFHQNNPKYISSLLSSIRSFDALVVATDELCNYYATKTTTPCFVIPNPLPNVPTKKSPLATKNLISVGRLVPDKDFPLLINAMYEVHLKDPGVHLTIVGDGSERPSLASQIESLKLKDVVTLTGWLSQDKIAELYLNSSLYVCTSRTEAFGLTIAEAMSYGLPCLALSRASGARAQVTNYTGVLLDTPTSTALAKNILCLINNPAKLKKYQPGLARHIEKYSPTTVKATWLAIFKSHKSST